MPTDEFGTRCRREVRALHEFFGAWYRAERPDTDDAFARVERALAPEFAMVTPEGSRPDREAVLDGVRAGHGAHAGDGDGATDGRFEIEVRTPTVADATANRCLVTYEEHHLPAGTARASSAWFRPAASAPNGVRWLFVHETWLDAPGPD